MSRAEINMLLIAIDLTDDSVRSYRDDAAGFVAAWESTGRARTAGGWEGGTLTAQERDAFAAFDYATLYRLGAHPFLLWQMVRSVAVTEEKRLDQVIDEYRRKIGPLGYLEFGT